MSQIPENRPTWRADFANAKTVPPQFSVTRSGSASYFDGNGVMRLVGADIPRIDHDPLTGECLGLLIEGASANYLLNSAQLSTQTVSVSSATYTLTFYGTGSIELSGAYSTPPIIGIGDKQRMSLTFTVAAGSLTLTVSGSVLNAQLEPFPYATSYINTAGAAAGRGRDDIVLSGDAFSSWFRQDQGSIAIDLIQGAIPSVAQYPITIAGSSGFQNFYGVRISPEGDVSIAANVSGIPHLSLSIGRFANGDKNRIVFAYQENNFAAASSMSELRKDTSGDLPTVERLVLGNWLGSGNQWYGHIKSIVYWATRIFDNQVAYLP